MVGWFEGDCWRQHYTIHHVLVSEHNSHLLKLMTTERKFISNKQRFFIRKRNHWKTQRNCHIGEDSLKYHWWFLSKFFIDSTNNLWPTDRSAVARRRMIMRKKITVCQLKFTCIQMSRPNITILQREKYFFQTQQRKYEQMCN